MEHKKEVIKLSKKALEQMIVEDFNRGIELEDTHRAKEVDFRWCEYDNIDNTITLRAVLTEVRGKKGPLRIQIKLEKDLSEGFGEENNNYFTTLYRGKGGVGETKWGEFKAELQEDFKEFLKNERREKSE